MAQKTIRGSENLAKQIKSRRNELGLTIEEAAARAEIGIKTWCRYEAGGAIRTDKCKGICKALNWRVLPDQETGNSDVITVQEFKNHKAWSLFLEKNYGTIAALSFAVGSDILLDHIEEDMREMSSLPIGSHIGQIGYSFLEHSLPEQFLMQYNYEFLYQMKCVLNDLRHRANAGLPMLAHSVLEELIIFLCNEEASALIGLYGGISEIESEDLVDCDEWVFDLFDDMDIITFLYSGSYLDAKHPYHYSRWAHHQFYTE